MLARSCAFATMLSPLNVIVHFGKNHERNLRRVLIIEMSTSLNSFTEKRLKSGVKETFVPVLGEAAISFTVFDDKLSLQVILSFFFPSQVVHSKLVEKMFAAFIPRPFCPICVLFTSWKLEPDIGTHTAFSAIVSPSSVFLVGIPLPLSSHVKELFVISMFIFVELS